MNLSSWQVFDRLYQPAYIGDNRCIPCTVVNLAIAVLIGIAIATVSLPAGVLSVVISGLLIYFRGYLVPGTPKLTKRYLPAPVMRLFHRHEAPANSVGAPLEPTIDVERLLVDGGVVAPCEDRDDLCLDPEFRAAWDDRMAELREAPPSRDGVGTMFDLAIDHLSLHEADDVLTATYNPPDGRWQRIGQWESSASYLADAASASLLSARLSGWQSLSASNRTAVLEGLRLFLDECPACRGPVRFGEEVVPSCCGSVDVIAASCEDCGARLFESELVGDELAT